MLIPIYGKSALAIYHALTARGFTGKTPKELIALAKADGVPSKVYSRGAREILRYWFPHIPPCMALQDLLVTKDRVNPIDAHDAARLAIPLFQKMDELGVLDKSSIAYSQQQKFPGFDKPPLMKPQLNSLPPNPFVRKKIA